MAKMRVAVLRGGPSDEYEVSMLTGSAVLEALADSEYEPLDVVITRSGEWLVDGFARQPQNALATTDAVFNALHGTYGEDGTVQRILTALGIPYTGSAPYPSSLAMNKILAKEHLYDLPIKSAPHLRVTADRSTDLPRLVYTLEDLMGPEFVVKPVTGGSSIGVSVATGAGELTRVLREALAVRPEVLVEKRIRGREATCAVIEGFRDEMFYTPPAIEIIIPQHEQLFTNQAKYSASTEEICPGLFTAAEKQTIAEYAKLVHQTLGLSQYSRSDFIVASDGVYFLEVNALPGLTQTSLVPQALAAVGSSHRELVHHLLRDTLTRNRRHSFQR